MNINELRKNSIEERDGFFQPAVFADMVATVAGTVVGTVVKNVVNTKKSGGYVANLAKSNYTVNPQYVCDRIISAERQNKMSQSISDVTILL